jgi:hypothetical protein
VHRDRERGGGHGDGDSRHAEEEQQHEEEEEEEQHFKHFSPTQELQRTPVPTPTASRPADGRPRAEVR